MKKLLLISNFILFTLAISAQEYCCNLPVVSINFIDNASDFMIRLGDKVYFQTFPQGELSVLDLNTKKIDNLDINPGSIGSYPTSFHALKDHVFFDAETSSQKENIFKIKKGEINYNIYVPNPGNGAYFYSTELNDSTIGYFLSKTASDNSFWTIKDPALAPEMLFSLDSGFHYQTKQVNYSNKTLYYDENRIFLTDGTLANSNSIVISDSNEFSVKRLITNNEGDLILKAWQDGGYNIMTYNIAKGNLTLIPELKYQVGSKIELIGLAMGKVIAYKKPPGLPALIYSYNPYAQTIDTLLMDNSFDYRLIGNILGDLYFSVGNKLWRTDGSKQGTIFIKEFPGGIDNVYNMSLEPNEIKFNHKCYFNANDNILGGELWSVGPGIDDIQLEKDFDPGSSGGLSKILNPKDSILYFLADSSNNKYGFYLLDPAYEPLSVKLIVDRLPECNMAKSGYIHAETKGSKGPFRYTWNYGIAHYDYLPFLDPGVYSITVTDGSGATVSAQIVLNEMPSFNTNVQVEDANLGQNNGQISLTVTGNSGPFNYSWSNNLPTIANVTNLAPGNYACTITDKNGCKSVINAEVKFKTATGSLLPSNIKIYPSIIKDHLVVDNSSGEQIIVKIKDVVGAQIFESRIEGKQEVELKDNHTTGLYIIVVYDAKMHYIGSQKLIKIN